MKKKETFLIEKRWYLHYSEKEGSDGADRIHG